MDGYFIVFYIGAYLYNNKTKNNIYIYEMIKQSYYVFLKVLAQSEERCLVPCCFNKVKMFKKTSVPSCQ